MKAGARFAASGDLPVPVEPLPIDLWRVVRVLWQRVLRISRRPARRLRLCESLPLGERRFVAVVEFEESRFLVGGTSGSLVLLARWEDRPTVPASSPGGEAQIAPEERP